MISPPRNYYYEIDWAGICLIAIGNKVLCSEIETQEDQSVIAETKIFGASLVFQFQKRILCFFYQQASMAHVDLSHKLPALWGVDGIMIITNRGFFALGSVRGWRFSYLACFA